MGFTSVSVCVFILITIVYLAQTTPVHNYGFGDDYEYDNSYGVWTRPQKPGQRLELLRSKRSVADDDAPIEEIEVYDIMAREGHSKETNVPELPIKITSPVVDVDSHDSDSGSSQEWEGPF